MYNAVGELHFLINTLAARAAQARLIVAELPDDPGDEPTPVDDPALTAVLDAFGGGPLGRTPLIYRLCVNLFVPGEGWLAGIPRELLPVGQRAATSLAVPVDSGDEPVAVLDGFAVDDLEWRALSRSEVSASVGGEVTLQLGEGTADRLVCSPDQVLLIRVWQPHPRKAWETDSATLATLPVLRKIVGLDARDMAQIESRLAGAGLLIVPQTAQRAVRATLGLSEDDETDPFTEALIEAMLTPIRDRGSASAVVPLIATVPDEATALFNYLDFAKPLDGDAPGMLDQAIRRLALGQNAPPELLLGTAGMNHWGGFLMQQDVVSTHLRPPLALVCDAVTREYYRPVLLDQGWPEERVRKIVIWPDTSDLVERPNRSQDAQAAGAAGILGSEAVRTEMGFDESQAPFAELGLDDPAVLIAFELARQSPALIGTPGLPQLAAQIRALLDGDIPDVQEAQPVPPGLEQPGQQPAADGPPPPGVQQIPETVGQPPTQPPPGQPAQQAASAAPAGASWNGGSDAT